MTRVDWIVLLFIFSVTGLWCYNEVDSLMDTQCHMVGLHPLVVFAIPLGSILSTAILVIAFMRKSILLGVLSVLPVIVLGFPIFFGYQLGIAGWSREIGRNSNVNEAAIRSVDFSMASFGEVPYKDQKRMAEVPGFRWGNSDAVGSAENGEFLGFTVDGVPHVYVCPLFNGARGVAWVDDPKTIGVDSSVRYEYTGVANWFIWTMSLR